MSVLRRLSFGLLLTAAGACSTANDAPPEAGTADAGMAPTDGPACADAQCASGQLCLSHRCAPDGGCPAPVCVDVLPPCGSCHETMCSGCLCHYDQVINCCASGSNGPCDESCFHAEEVAVRDGGQVLCGRTQ